MSNVKAPPAGMTVEVAAARDAGGELYESQHTHRALVASRFKKTSVFVLSTRRLAGMAEAEPRAAVTVTDLKGRNDRAMMSPGASA
jgi:hypothetical protein